MVLKKGHDKYRKPKLGTAGWTYVHRGKSPRVWSDLVLVASAINLNVLHQAVDNRK